MKRILVTFVFASTAVYGSSIYLATNGTSTYSSVTTAATLTGSSDYVKWAQIVPGAVFSAYSTESSEKVVGTLATGTVTEATACSSCIYQSDNGIGSNDALVLTNSASSQGAQLTLYTNSTYGLGAYIQAANAAGDTDAQFTVRLQAYAGNTSVLNTIVTSDSIGDAMFVGVSDATAEITKVVFSYTDAYGNATAGNFVLDKLYLLDAAPVQLVQQLDGGSGVPEPGMLSLVGSGLLALVFGLKKRSARA